MCNNAMVAKYHTILIWQPAPPCAKSVMRHPNSTGMSISANFNATGNKTTQKRRLVFLQYEKHKSIISTTAPSPRNLILPIWKGLFFQIRYALPVWLICSMQTSSTSPRSYQRMSRRMSHSRSHSSSPRNYRCTSPCRTSRSPSSLLSAALQTLHGLELLRTSSRHCAVHSIIPGLYSYCLFLVLVLIR